MEWTPGHTPGHVIVWEDRLNLVLLGDHVLPTASPNIGIDPDLEGNPLPGYLESLRGLAARPGQVALPGHGHRFDLVARAQQLLAHQEDRAARVLAAVRDGADYIGCGPTFPSGTKSFDEFPGVAFLKQVAEEVRLPAFAIGGITLENVASVVAVGMARVAVGGALANVEDVVHAVEQWRFALNGVQPRSGAGS